MSTQDLASLMSSRAAMYNLIARVFRVEVDEDFLKTLKTMHYPQNTGEEAIDAAYREIHAFMCHTREATLDNLAIDYARCFLGSGSVDAEAAFPFESVYTSSKGLLMQDARDQVLAIYRSEGISKSSNWREAEDHLSAELEFMAILSTRTAEALAQNEEGEAVRLLITQRNFLNDHILRWTPKFFADVPRFSKTSFYPAFAKLLKAYLTEDITLLEKLVGPDDATQQTEEKGGDRD